MIKWICHQRQTSKLLPSLSAEEISAAEQCDESDAVQSLATYKNRLARSLTAVVNVIDPDIVVLGGGISNVETLYPGLIDLMSDYAFSDGITTKVVRAAHGDSTGARGAAWLWPIERT
jgi:fructokinase